MQSLRRGDCPGCPHDVIDDRDLKFNSNVCGFHFAQTDVPLRWLRRLPLAWWGHAEVVLFGGTLMLLAIAAALLSPFAALPPLLLALFVFLFFRDPARQVPDTTGAIVSPADGVVTDVEELSVVPFWDGPATKIGIYLSVFNVHLNRAPETARVIQVCYNPGRFLDTWTRAAARVNENCWTVFECEAPPHRLIAVKQIAGTFARRIVCAARPGTVLDRGERFGMIKFGSRTELYLEPAPDLRIIVKPGDRIRGGSSVVAQYAL
jgi:phosphatidylserine decarboxylase